MSAALTRTSVMFRTDAHEFYPSGGDTAQPWLHLTAASPVDVRPRLSVTTWIHHDTAWITVNGPLIHRTAPTLYRVFTHLRAEPLRETVLNLCSLTDLDPAGVQCIMAELQESRQQGRELEVVASWNTTEYDEHRVRRVANPVQVRPA